MNIKNKKNITLWIQNYMAEILCMKSEEIDPSISFERFSLNSASAVALIGDLEEELDIELSPALLFEFSTIDAITDFLVEECSSNTAV